MCVCGGGGEAVSHHSGAVRGRPGEQCLAQGREMATAPSQWGGRVHNEATGHPLTSKHYTHSTSKLVVVFYKLKRYEQEIDISPQTCC